MARGDILLVDLPQPRGERGHEQVGSRPAVVVQTDSTSGSLPTIMIVPLSGRLNALRFPHTIRIEPSDQNGLSETSVLLVFQLRAIDRRRIIQKVGFLEQAYLERLNAEIRHMLEL